MTEARGKRHEIRGDRRETNAVAIETGGGRREESAYLTVSGGGVTTCAEAFIPRPCPLCALPARASRVIPVECACVSACVACDACRVRVRVSVRRVFRVTLVKRAVVEARYA